MTFRAPGRERSPTANRPIGPASEHGDWVRGESSPSPGPEGRVHRVAERLHDRGDVGMRCALRPSRRYRRDHHVVGEAPSTSTPRMRRFSQMCARPVRHVEHRPQRQWVSAATNAAGLERDGPRSRQPRSSRPPHARTSSGVDVSASGPIRSSHRYGGRCRRSRLRGRERAPRPHRASGRARSPTSAPDRGAVLRRARIVPAMCGSLS